MTKTKETLDLEHYIWQFTHKEPMSTNHGAFEVTLGGSQLTNRKLERVDYVTCDNQGQIRCYELKISYSDLHSSAALSFVGDYNYLVISQQLYYELQQRQEHTKWGIGIIVEDLGIVKKPRKRTVDAGDRAIIIQNMLRALDRDFGKLYTDKVSADD